MSEPILPRQDDVTHTGALRVTCSGPSWSAHPKVYLTMVDDAKGQPDHVVCPYCGHVFAFDAKAARPAAH